MTWATASATAPYAWESVTVSQGEFVAVASNGITHSVMTSPDGIAWTSRVSATTSAWKALTDGNGVINAVSNNPGSEGTNQVLRSAANLNLWVAGSSAASSGWESVAYGTPGGRRPSSL